MGTKAYTVKSIPEETISLLQDAAKRASRETGYPIAFQAFLRKALQDVADVERAAQEAASQEYAKQQQDSANS